MSRPHDAAKTVLAAGDRGPAERDRVEHGGERERQQREIHAAAAQDERAEQGSDQRDNADADQNRGKEAAGKQLALRDAGRVGRQAEPGAVAERDEARCSRRGY